MADTSTDQTPPGDGQPANARLQLLLQGVTSFLPSALPQDLDALKSFLASPLRMKNIASNIIPPAEEARIRLELAQQLQGAIREQLGG